MISISSVLPFQVNIHSDGCPEKLTKYTIIRQFSQYFKEIVYFFSDKLKIEIEDNEQQYETNAIKQNKKKTKTKAYNKLWSVEYQTKAIDGRSACPFYVICKSPFKMRVNVFLNC